MIFFFIEDNLSNSFKGIKTEGLIGPIEPCIVSSSWNNERDRFLYIRGCYCCCFCFGNDGYSVWVPFRCLYFEGDSVEAKLDSVLII